MTWGIKLGRVAQTPFGQISDASVRVGLGKYAIQCMLVLVFVLMEKGFYLVGIMTAAITIAMYYQWPLMRFLAWRRPWLGRYFYGHLSVSILVGVAIGDDRAGWAFLWICLSAVFAFSFMALFTDDIEDLLQGRITFDD